MPTSALVRKKGFWGLNGPPPGRPCRAVVCGPGGAFFNAVVRASFHVETYDEEYECEAYRRGIRTEVRSAAAVSSLVTQGRPFACLLGYPTLPFSGTEQTGAVRVVLSHDGALASSLAAGDILIGPRGGAPSGRGRRPRVVTAREMWGGKRGRKALPARDTCVFLVVDPLVMEPGLFPVRENVEPGGLSWYSLAALIKELFSGTPVRGVLIRPRLLPRGDPLPAFVLARLVSKILTAAVVHGGRGK